LDVFRFVLALFVLFRLLNGAALPQFAPQVGDVDNNLNRADAVLSKANPQNLDLLVLPELAFSGESSCPSSPSLFLDDIVRDASNPLSLSRASEI
jgi:predicted amidohydrolase